MLSFSRSILLSYRNLMLADHHSIASLMRTSGLPKIEQSRLIELCKMSIEKLKNQSALVRINGPAVVVGDLHGSIIDLLRIFGIYGLPFNNDNDGKNMQKNNKTDENSGFSLKFVFLGDYIDRGDFSVEVVTLLLSAFCLYPNNIVLLRGNHEFCNVSSTNGFKDEILDHPSGYTPELFERIHEVFAFLPYAAVINNNVFCVHGGLSNKLTNLQDIEKLSELRPIYDYKEIPLIQDLVWSDPSTIGSCDFIPSTRNQGCVYGSTAVNNFYHNTGIQAIIRGHSYVKEGVAIYPHINLLSVFSSSNYLNLPIKMNPDAHNNHLHSFLHDSTLKNDFENEKSILKKNDNGNLSGIVYVDEESKISPEIFEAVEKVVREETKLRTTRPIAFASSQIINRIQIVPNVKTDSANDQSQSKDESNINAENIPKPKKQFSINFYSKSNDDNQNSSLLQTKNQYHIKRKMSHGSIQKNQYKSPSNNEEHIEESSSASNCISENSSSSSNSSRKNICNDSYDKMLTNKPVMLRTPNFSSKKRKSKKSLPSVKVGNII